MVPTLGHFFRDTKEGSGGGYGGSLETVITDALSFVRNHPTEFIILRFSHTQCPDQVADLIEQIYDRDGNDDYIFTGDVNIAQCRLAQLKKHVIMIFDSKFNKQRLQSVQDKKILQTFRKVTYKPGRGLAAKGMHLFTKYKDGKPCPNGLCTCGKFASSDKMSKVYEDSLKAAKEHLDHPSDHLCFVYWQLTGGRVEDNMRGGDRDARQASGFSPRSRAERSATRCPMSSLTISSTIRRARRSSVKHHRFQDLDGRSGMRKLKR